MRVRHRGFTLIELMVVVAIIGLLSSVAIPSFRRFQLRSKTAERTLIISSIERAVDDYYARETAYPTITSATSSELTTSWNPPLPPTPDKRPLNMNLAGWNKLSLRIDGNVYYSYYVNATANGVTRQTYTYGVGDLDGDRDWMRFTYCYQYHLRNFTGSALVYDYWYDTARDVPQNVGCF
jgi:prepilin-type N-terminal cleavage/methylation domain-containing protein